MNKSAIVQSIIAKLTHELERYAASAKAAHAEATHEQSKAENKYDTRGLEASYLAHGQSKQAAEVEQARADYEVLKLREFTAETPIDLTALVELTANGERCFYFIGPRAGGTEVEQAGHEILTITPQSPLGRELIGKKVGDRFHVGLALNRRVDYAIISVW